MTVLNFVSLETELYFQKHVQQLPRINCPSEPHSRPEGGDNATKSSLPTTVKQQEEEAEEVVAMHMPKLLLAMRGS